jgi:hypothetical protein
MSIEAEGLLRRRLPWLGLIAIALGVRIYNAYHYPLGWGFDAEENWRYIAGLMRSWALPDPDEGWSTAHPPLFYYLSAAVMRGLDIRHAYTGIVILRLLIACFGLGIVAVCALLVQRVAPADRRRALIAAGLLLFLPAHLYMSAMLGEELIAAFFSTLVIGGVAWEFARPQEAPSPWLTASLIGVAAGLAWMTKLTGVIALVAAVASYALAAPQLGGPRRAAQRIALVLVFGTLIGGWFYARNLAVYGYLYPHGLPQHQVMYSMPPGERHPGDYVRIPLATFTDPQLLNPDLLHSVWGGTYATLYFDGHRHFLPRKNRRVTRAGTLLLVLGLLPTAAFFVGFTRGARRAWSRPRSPDTPLVLVTLGTLAGYVLFTLKNPWFAVVKGSFLLSLCLPFSYYASETLSGWMGLGGARSKAVWAWLLVLWLAAAVIFLFAPLFWGWPLEHALGPGLHWRAPE